MSLKFVRRLLALTMLLLCMLSLIVFIGCGVLRYRDHGSGETFLFYVTRNSPSYQMAGFQIWSSGGAIRIAYARFERDAPDESLPPNNLAGQVPPFFQHAEYSPGPNPVPVQRDIMPESDRVSENSPFQWFRRDYSISGYSERQLSICAPAWFYLATTGITPAIFLLLATRRLRTRIIARRRRQRGLCTACGYDLRESPGLCPECGLGVDQRGRNSIATSAVVMARLDERSQQRAAASSAEELPYPCRGKVVPWKPRS
jgi:hypothetical protein